MSGEIEKFANDILDIVKNNFRVSPILLKQRNGRINFFFIILGLGFKKRNYMHFSKQDSAIQLMHQIKPIFDPKGILNPYTCLPDVKWISTSKHIFVIKLEYDLLVTWVQIWNTSFYIFWHYTIKFYNSNLNIANHNLCF